MIPQIEGLAQEILESEKTEKIKIIPIEKRGNMTDNKIIETAKACIKFIEEDKGNSSFVNVERIMEQNGISTQDDDKGGWFVPWDIEYDNIIVWDFNNEAMAEVWRAIFKCLEADDKSMELQVSQPLVYLVDGKILALPLAKSLRHYKQPHWLPVVLSIQDKK